MDKNQSRQRWQELRDIWNDSDPIGVIALPDCPRDEYDGYVSPTMRLLEIGASLDEIVAYLEHASGYMGLDFDRPRAIQCGSRIIDWFKQNWQS